MSTPDPGMVLQPSALSSTLKSSDNYLLTPPTVLDYANSSPRFVHGSEILFALLLDAIDIRYVYEPFTFLIGRGPTGKYYEGGRAFTPDFYLPELELYVEVTYSPTSNSRKNGKINDVKRLCPDIEIKLFGYNKMEKLLEKMFSPEDIKYAASLDVSSGCQTIEELQEYYMKKRSAIRRGGITRTALINELFYGTNGGTNGHH